MSDVAAIREAQEKLSAIYRDPQQYDLLAQMTAPADLPFYRRLLGTAPASVLELACGSGRVAIELADAGFEVTGIDLSAALIRYAASKAETRGVAITLLQADLRSFDCQRTFDWLLLPYNGFNHLLTLADQRAFLERARAHMSASSRLIIDTFQPSPSFLGGTPEARRTVLRYRDPYTQQEVLLDEEHHYDPATQIDRVHWFYTIGGVPEARKDQIPMRLFFPQELDALIELNGLRIERKLGDYDESAFGARSSKQLVVCRLA